MLGSLFGMAVSPLTDLFGAPMSLFSPALRAVYAGLVALTLTACGVGAAQTANPPVVKGAAASAFCAARFRSPR